MRSSESEETEFAIKTNLEARLTALFGRSGNGEARPGFREKWCRIPPGAVGHASATDPGPRARSSARAAARRASNYPGNRSASRSLPGITLAGAQKCRNRQKHFKTFFTRP